MNSSKLGLCSTHGERVSQTPDAESVIIFGSGASYGAGEVSPDPPPLGDELFDKLADFSPRSWGKLSPEDFAADSFETGMRLTWQKNQNRAEVLKQLMDELARFFMQFRLGEHAEDCYSGLLRGLESEGRADSITLATLNYDTLLEQAIELAGMDYAYAATEPNGKALVLKIHGSANWVFCSPGDHGRLLYDPGHDTAVDRSQTVLVRDGFKITGSDITLLGNFESQVSTGEEDWVKSQLEEGYLPCLAAYMEGKPYIGFTDSFARFNQRLLESRILGAPSVILCGTKPNLDDQHLWGPLARTEAPLGYVGDVRAFDEWNEFGKPQHPPQCLGDKFCYSVRNMIDFVVRPGAVDP